MTELTLDSFADEATDSAHVGNELLRHLHGTDSPRRLFDRLHNEGTLHVHFPELAALAGIPAGPEEYHGEGDALEHTLRVVEAMNDQRPNDVEALLAALAHDLGKALTDEETLPNHYGHANRGVTPAVELADSLELDDSHREAMRLGARLHMRLGLIGEMGDAKVVKVAEMLRESPLTPGQMADLRVADCLGREPEGEFDRELVESQLEAAIEACESVGEVEVCDRHGMDVEDIGSEMSRQNFDNLIHQHRVETFRDLIRE